MANSRLGLRTRPGLIRSYTEITSGDPDANAFISAAGLTDATQKNAINQLVVDLKAYGIWTKMKAIYPFVGGTSSTHKWNLKDPRDLDAAFRLVFSGGWTHSSTGALPNGVNAYADTKLSPGNNTIINNFHCSYYSLTEQNAAVEIGCDDGGIQLPILEFSLRRTGNIISDIYDYSSNRASASNSSSIGFGCASRISNVSHKAYFNGIVKATDTNTQVYTSLQLQSIAIGCLLSNGVGLAFSAKECAFASIGDGLTDTEAANLYTAVQAFETTLGRQV